MWWGFGAGSGGLLLYSNFQRRSELVLHSTLIKGSDKDNGAREYLGSAVAPGLTQKLGVPGEVVGSELEHLEQLWHGLPHSRLSSFCPLSYNVIQCFPQSGLTLQVK